MLICVQFVETQIFTNQVDTALTHDEYVELQQFLAVNPKAGDVIPGTGGVRKLRWSDETRSRGKRGGHRVIYFYRANHEQLLMLMLYSKTGLSDLTKKQKQQLKQVVSTWS